MREASMMQSGVGADNSPTEEIVSERRLWTAVMAKAVEEWRTGTLRARRQAQQFLFEDHADFGFVCACAGLDPDGPRARLLKIGNRLEPHVRLAHTMAA